MKLSRPVVIAAAAALVTALIISLPVFAAPNAEQKRLAALANDEGTFKREQAEQARRNAAQERSARGAKMEVNEFERLCKLKPVMSDAEIDSCRKAYRL